MPLTKCPECGGQVSEDAIACPHCGHPLKVAEQPPARRYRGWQWKSKAQVLGVPFVHIAWGRDPETGKLLVAKGVIAIGQFAIGLITIAQFGVGLLFGFGQFVAGAYAIGQVALAVKFGIGQVATGYTAIGQFAFGWYTLGQLGFGKYVWSMMHKDAEAVEYFVTLWNGIKALLGP